MPTDKLTNAAITDLSGLDLLSIDNAPQPAAGSKATQVPDTGVARTMTDAAPKAVTKTALADLDLLSIKGDAPAAGGGSVNGDQLFGALLHQESGGRQFDKRGKLITSSAGALGIAQVMPGTAPEAARLAGVPFDDYKYKNDVDYNAKIGRAYYNKQLADFGDPSKALAAYNAGPGAMRNAQAKANKNGTPDQWLSYLPQETQKYVPSILARAKKMSGAPAQAAQGTPAAASQGPVREHYTNIHAAPPPKGYVDTAIDGFKGGFTSSQGLGAQMGALALKTLGLAPELQERLLTYGEGKHQEVAKSTGEVSSFSDALKPEGDLGRWAASSLGYLGYQVLESVMTGGAGALVAKSVGKGLVASTAKGMLENEVGKLTASAAAKSMTKEQIEALAAGKVAAKLGAASTVFANNLRQEGGSIYGDAVRQAELDGTEVDLGKVWTATVGATVVDTAADLMMAKGLLGMKQGSTAGSYAGRLAQELPKNMAVQGGTEAVQTGIEQWGANRELDTKDIIDSAAVGALGGTAGALGVAMHKRQAELAPVAERAAQGGTLSKAAMAGNTGAAADAEFAANFEQAAAGAAQEEVANKPPVDGATRLAELERISKGGPSVTDPNTGNSSIAGADARFFTTEEKTEYDQLKSLKETTDQAAGKTAPDALEDRVKTITASARSQGTLDALRQEQSPVAAKQFVNDLAIARSTSTTPALREQALHRLEFAAEWAGANPAPSLAPASEETVSSETESSPTTMEDGAIPSTAKAQELLRQSDLTDVDRSTLVNGLSVANNNRMPAPARQAAKEAVNEVIGRNVAPQATTAAEPATSPSLLAKQEAAPGSASEALAQANRHEEGAALFRAMGFPDLAEEHDTQADLAREEAVVRQQAEPVAQVAQTNVQVAQTNVQAPRVTIPAGEGSAVFRKRREMFSQLIADGLSTVERRHDGNFFLVSSNRKRQFKLDGMADAQLARKALQDHINQGANLANTNPTPAQASAGNYKKGRVDFDGLQLGIENPVGSERKGKAPDGTEWAVTMSAHYGDATGTIGKDGDGLDVYLVKNPRPGSPVYVIDQYDGDNFDETKSIAGEPDQAKAIAIYDAHFSDGSGPLRRGSVTAMTMAEFKAWSKSPESVKPAGAARATAAPDVAAAVDQTPDTLTVQLDGKPHKVTLVSPAKDGSARRPGKGVQISPEKATMLQALAGIFGKQVDFFADDTIGDGFVMPEQQPSKIYLNEKGSINPLAVFGHEFLHHLEREMPLAHAALVKVISANLSPESRAAFRKDYYRDATNNTAPLAAAELNEITSDIGGNLMTDGAFWGEVFAQMEADNPSQAKGLIAELAARLLKLIDQLMAAVTQSNFKSTELVTDLAAVRAEFKGALAKYLTANQISPASMQAKILRAAQQARTSTAAVQRSPSRSPATGIHFSKEERSAIHGSFYGTGMRGAEAKRLQNSNDARLKQRSYFYVDEGNGVTPESGVGSVAHEVALPKLYDARANAEGLWNSADLNATEARILDAGYGGYYVHDIGNGQGAAVVLGDAAKSLPAKRVDHYGHAGAALPSMPTTKSKSLLSKDIEAVHVEDIPGAKLRFGTMTVPLESVDAANDEMMRIGSVVRFSPARAEDAALSEFDAVKDKYQGTEQWLKAPNGQASKLDERQWIHVRTPSFKKWFGDWEAGNVWARDDVSKAVDANGEPAVVYHGSNQAGFTTFNRPGGKERGDLGIFTASDWSTAASYITKGRAKAADLATPQRDQAGLEEDGFSFETIDDGRIEVTDPDGYSVNAPAFSGYRFATMEDAVKAANNAAMPEKNPGVYALFVNLRNPAEENFEGAMWNGEREGQYQVVDDDGEPVYSKDGRAYFGSQEEAAEVASQQGGEVEVAGPMFETTDSVVRQARKYNNDGTIIREVIDDGSGNGSFAKTDLFIAFEPNQLKSADFNRGGYSLRENDVRLSPARADGNKTNVAALPKGRAVPESAGVGSLELALQQARSKSYRTGRQLKVDLQAAVLAAAKEAKVNLSVHNQENFKFLVGMVTRDAELALQSNENAIGWYDTTVSRAIGALATVHPEIETDPVSRLAFLWALATTSNGLKVDKNFELAEKAYSQWQASHADTVKRIMPASAGIGNAAKSINKGLALFNSLADKMGHDRLFKFMATEFQVGQIAGMFGEKPGGEWQATPVLGSAVLGPKIGNGFFSNLNGYFDALTIDRWLMRTWGRLTGTLLQVDPAKVNQARGKLDTAITNMTEAERRAMAKLMDHPVRLRMTRQDLDSLSHAVAKHSMDPDERELMNVSAATTRLRLDGNGLHKFLDGQKEAPSGPAERNWMRAVFAKTLEDLRADGKDMTMSDLQALLWYPERRLYDAAKSDEDTADGYTDDEAPDYANAAQKLALGKGIPQAQIKDAMTRSELRGTVRGESLTEAEKEAMLKEFKSAPEQGIHMVFEVAPDPAATELVAQWEALSAKDKARITKLVKDTVVGEVAKELGIEVHATVQALGGYAGMINPNMITEYKQTKVSITQARALAGALGFVLDQNSVALIDPRADGNLGMVRVTLDSKAEPHAADMLKAIQALVPGVDAFTARGNNFDVLNFPEIGMTTEALESKISEAMDQLGLDVESRSSSGETQSELITKDTYGTHIDGLRPGSGQEIRGGVERIRDRTRTLVASEIRSAGERGVRPGARARPERAGAARRDAVGPAQLSPFRDAGGARGDGQSQALDSRPQPGTRGTSLKGIPEEIVVDGELIRFGAFKPAQDAAEAYTKSAGIPFNPPKSYARVDPIRAKRIADAFEAMPHAPNDPLVKRAYQAMIDETAAQYEALLATGLKVEFMDVATTGDPYGNPRNAILDVTRNNHLWIYPTEVGFGASETADVDVSGTPMLQPTRFKISGKTALANDLFRVVHDYFGHIAEGVGFRADGEENTWRKHSAMFTPLAQRALTTETRGQNSWVNFGPHAEFNKTANGADTQYAPQKVGLLPQWVSDEGRADTIQQSPARQAASDIVDLRKRVSMLKALQKCLG